MSDTELDLGSRSPVSDVEMDDDPNVKRKGRGFNPRGVESTPDGVRADGFETLDDARDEQDRAARSVEGWVVVVTNVHEEATEEEVIDKFADFGQVKTCHLNLDRRTGYVKGYALLEYDTKEEATAAIEACSNGLTLLDEQLAADFAFVQPPAGRESGTATRGRRSQVSRNRSRSPDRR